MTSTQKTVSIRKIKFIKKTLSLIDSFKSTNLPYEILEIIIDYKKRMEETIKICCTSCRNRFDFNKQHFLQMGYGIRFAGLICEDCNYTYKIRDRDGWDNCGATFKTGFYNMFIQEGVPKFPSPMNNKHYIVNIIKVNPKTIKFTIQDISSNNETEPGPVDKYPSEVYCKRIKFGGLFDGWGHCVPLPLSKFNTNKNDNYVIRSQNMWRIDN